MTRKTIELPKDFHFRTQYTVLFSDINSANHLGADRIQPITTETQQRFIKSLGYDNALIFEDAGLIMVHSEIEYKSETDYAHELIIDMAISNFKEKSIEFAYRIFNDTKDIETARMITTMLFFDYDKKSVTTIPKGFKEKLLSLKTLS